MQLFLFLVWKSGSYYSEKYFFFNVKPANINRRSFPATWMLGQTAKHKLCSIRTVLYRLQLNFHFLRKMSTETNQEKKKNPFYWYKLEMNFCQQTLGNQGLQGKQHFCLFWIWDGGINIYICIFPYSQFLHMSRKFDFATAEGE